MLIKMYKKLPILINNKKLSNNYLIIAPKCLAIVSDEWIF